MTRKLDETLHAIGDPATALGRSLLGNLSALSANELSQFQAAWSGYTAARRVELLRALIELAEEHVQYDFRAIFNWSLHDDDPQIRLLSVDGLWEDERPSLISHFVRMLHADSDADVRAEAAVALGRFVYWGEIGSLANHHAEDAAQALWDRLHESNETVHVRRRALEGIAASSDPAITRAIENALYDADQRMRVSALYAMGRNADPRWIPYLTPELTQPDPELRLEAVRALGELEARSAVAHILQMLTLEADMEVRLAAVAALGQIGGQDARQALETMTTWDDEIVVSAAEEALEELLSGENSTYELINEILGINADEDDFLTLEDEFYEDPLDLEIRRLLDERDEWQG